MMHRLTHAQPLPALHGSKPVARKPHTTLPVLDALKVIQGGQRADMLLEEVKHSVAHPNALFDLVNDLVTDPAALEGAMRTIQKALEVSP